MFFIDVVEWVTVMNHVLYFPISTINRIADSQICDKRNVTGLNRERTENSLNTITLHRTTLLLRYCGYILKAFSNTIYVYIE